MDTESKVKRAQRVRLQYLRMSIISYGLALFVAALGAALNLLEWRYVFWFFLFAAGVSGGLYACFRSGLNLRFDDPSFVALQNLLPLAPMLFLIYQADSALGRSALLIVSLSGVLYGALNLEIRRFLVVIAVYVAGYCGLFLVMAIDPLKATDSAPGEWMILTAVASFMLQMGLLGSYIGRLRTRLTQHSERIRELAIRDELTGSYNRRYLIDTLDRERARAERGRAFSVCLMDIDHFKQVNDRYGHAVGDEVLCGFTQLIRKSIREIDTCGRYGGEEFLLIMPESAAGAARAVAERLHAAIEAHTFDADGQTFSVTLSLGVAESRVGEPYAALLQRADKALYDAKHGGRNGVVVAK